MPSDKEMINNLIDTYSNLQRIKKADNAESVDSCSITFPFPYATAHILYITTIFIRYTLFLLRILPLRYQ